MAQVENQQHFDRPSSHPPNLNQPFDDRLGLEAGQVAPGRDRPLLGVGGQVDDGL